MSLPLHVPFLRLVETFLILALLPWPASVRTQHRLAREQEMVRAWPEKSKRWALIIGVDQYRDAQISPLRGSVNDAHLLASALIRYAGFPADQVIVLANDQAEERQPTRINIWAYFSNLAALVPKDGLLLISFAGHGIERNNQAYLIPSDARLTHDIALLEDSAVSVTRMHDRIKAIGASQVIVLLDACRNDPGGRADVPNKLTAAYTKFNFDVRNKEVEAFATIYATEIGERAYEYTEKQQGYFTWALVEGLKGGAANEQGEVTLAGLLKYVQENVPKRIAVDLGSDRRQKPFAIIEGYRANELVIAVKSGSSEAVQEQVLWEAIKDSNDRQRLSEYLVKYPTGSHAGTVRTKLRLLDEGNLGSNTNKVNSVAGDAVAKARAELRERGVGMDVNGVKNALLSVDVELLNLLSAVGVPATIIEEALRQRVGGGEGTVARRFFANSKQSAEAMKWFEMALANGVNANMMVSTGGYYESEAVLVEAMRAANVSAIKILLEHGASPHPYQDIYLTRNSRPEFIFPIRYIADDERLAQSEKQILTKLFIAAGAVIPYVAAKGINGHATAMLQALRFQEQSSQRLGITLTASRPFCEQTENPICKRAGGDWCATLRKMPNKLVFNSASDYLSIVDVTLVYLLHIEGNKAYFLAMTREPYRGNEYLLVEVAKDSSNWKILKYKSPSNTVGECNPDKYGERTFDYCWREVPLYRVSGTDEMRYEPLKLSWKLTTQHCSTVLPQSSGADQQ